MPILSDKKPFAWGVLPLHYVLKNCGQYWESNPYSTFEPINTLSLFQVRARVYYPLKIALPLNRLSLVTNSWQITFASLVELPMHRISNALAKIGAAVWFRSTPG
jgi:hypothetical protein